MTVRLPSLLCASIGVAAVLATAALAQTAPNPLRIGIAAPLSGPSAILGAQVVAGAREAMVGQSDVTLLDADTECSPEGGKRAADRFIAEKVEAVAGFLCTEALEAALAPLSQAGIPVVVIGVRANRFTDTRAKSGALVWRLAPRADAGAKAVAALIGQRWRDGAFGLVDDGTIDGRALSDAVRILVEADGLKPVTVDNYRPAEEKQFGLVRRIDGAGATRLFIAGDRPDVAIIARDAGELGLALEIVGGETLLDEPGIVPLKIGTLAVAPRQPAADRLQPAEAREAYIARAVAATEVLIAALREQRRSAAPLAAILDGTTFSTVLGSVDFDAKGDAEIAWFGVLRFDGSDFVAEPEGQP